MTKYKAVAPFPFQTPLLAGEVTPGSVHDLPDQQADGKPLIWPAEFWQPVDKPSPSPAPESENQ